MYSDPAAQRNDNKYKMLLMESILCLKRQTVVK